MHVLITAGPTREYLDDVRYLSNASSGRMGYAIAAAAVSAGWRVSLVSGPVELSPPEGVELIAVETTDEMRSACEVIFGACCGVIAVAAVCDYRPRERVAGKIAKTGDPVTIEMIETDDVLAGLGRQKGDRWVVGFALEAQNPRENALQKLRRKNCDLIALNAPSAIGAAGNTIDLLDGQGGVVAHYEGAKESIAAELIATLQHRFPPTR